MDVCIQKAIKSSVIEQQEASSLCKNALEWDVCCTDVKEIKWIGFVSGTKWVFWLQAWTRSVNPSGCCCTAIQPYDGTEVPGGTHGHALA